MQAERFLAEEGWSLAGRDDCGVARAIREGEALDCVYTLEEEAAIDELLRYLNEQGFVAAFERLASHMRVKRINVPPVQYVWLYFVKVLMGVEGMAAMSPLLLRDESLMRLLGFNAHQIEHGTTRRGDHRRGPSTEREGPVSTEAVAENIVKLSVLAMATFFNSIAQRCVARCVQGDEVDVIIDCSDLETTEKYEGAGRVRRKHKVKRRSSPFEDEVEITIFGWKVGVAYHADTGLPLSVCVAPINRSDQALFWTVLDDARKNLNGKRIRSVVIDRGFFDGEDLWKLDQMGIEFVIPSRSNMRVHQDALALAARYGRKGEQHDDVVVDSEDIHLVEGYGKARKTRKVQTVLVGVSNLTSLDSYGPPGHKDKQNNKDFQPNPIHAVVVREWCGQTFKEPKVLLTNGDAHRPFKPFRRYDDRSLIENGIFREAKQDWSLERPPQKNAAGVTVHVYMTLAAMALVRCYRQEMEAPVLDDAPPDDPVETFDQRAIRLRLGMKRYRRRLKRLNQDRVIIFLDDAYGIFHVQEMAMLSGLRLKTRSRGIGTLEETLHKFGLSP